MELRKARVLLVDDHPVFALGIATLLERERDFEVVGQAYSAIEAIEMYAQTSVDLIVIDILLGSVDGIACMRDLVRTKPTAVLGLSVLDEPVRIAQMLRAGACGFVNKAQPFDEIVDAIRLTLAGTRYISPRIRDAVEALTNGRDRLPLEQLTEREREVFDRLISGLGNTAIGVALGIRPRTVETHRQHIMRKLGAHSLADLVRFASRWGVST